MRRIDDAFANNIRAALGQTGQDSAWQFLYLVAGLLGCGLLWANFAVLDEVTTGEGRIIPSQQVQVVQSLYPGIVSEIFIAEGEVVDAGQPLITIDDTTALSELGEATERLDGLRAKASRLAAEAEGRAFAPDALDLPAERLAQEKALFEARRDSLEQSLAVARQQATQRELERDEIAARLETTESTVASFDRELTMARRLRSRGAMPEMDYLRLDRQAQAEKRELTVLGASLPRAEAAIAEARAREASLTAEFRSNAREELAGSLAEIAVLEEARRRLSDKADRTVLRSPVRGVVKTLPVTSIGAVVQSAATLVEIVPVDDALLIEARINPKDVAFLHPGQTARIKVTAYDYTLYGDLAGTLIRIGADSVVDEQGQIYYRATLETEKNYLGATEGELPIFPGMVVSVDIATGRKSVLTYLLEPVNQVREEALRER